MTVTTARVAYGTEAEQFGELTIPERVTGPCPCVILIHGGFWKAPYGLDLMRPLAADLCELGVTVWNLEYRRVGHPGGGYPGTLADIAAGVDRVVGIDDRLDHERVVVVGHSAGGHLALWSACRHLLRNADVGARPLVRPIAAVGLAAVTDLRRSARDGLGAQATQAFLGGEPSDVPDAYRVAQPVLGVVPTLLVTGDNDDDVPDGYSRDQADRLDVYVVDGEDHFDVIDPTSRSWRVARAAIDAAANSDQDGPTNRRA